MPLQPEEVLADIRAATDEAKHTIQELHSARKQYMATVKDARAKIADSIVNEVHAQVLVLSDDAAREMREHIGRVIRSLEGAWRDKLGLP